ncbi:MAG TPA: sulfur carrier protein ThiS [Blastocatellia bacterium]
MSITVNGKETELPNGASINDLILSLGLTPHRLAVELNGRIVRRANWDSTSISDGDRVEIVHFVGGGEK